LQKSSSLKKMQAAPNPFTEKITVQFTSSYKGNAEIRIANIAGVIAITKQFAVNAGSNSFYINAYKAYPGNIHGAIDS